jgi:hypothetical protein
MVFVLREVIIISYLFSFIQLLPLYFIYFVLNHLHQSIELTFFMGLFIKFILFL